MSTPLPASPIPDESAGAGRQSPSPASQGAEPAPLPRRYRLIRLLGQGGEGRVYEVEDLYRGGERLALKILPLLLPESSPPEALRKEFLILSRLAHPALARVWDFGFFPDGSAVYFTSDYIEGVDLLSWFLDHPVKKNWPAAISFASQLLSALHAVHRAGIFHGDLKPANVIIVPLAGKAESAVPVKLIDFGGAGLSSLGLGRKRDPWLAAGSARRLLTPAYRPPPGLCSDGRDEDLYALGMTLFHSVTGKLPFELGNKANQEIWWKAGREARLSECLEEPAPVLDELLARLTSPRPGERFHSAAEGLQFLKARASLSLNFIPHGRGRAGLPQGWAGQRLHGREKDLEAVWQAWSGAGGEGESRPPSSVVLLAAQPGMGKSQFLDALLACAQVEGWKTALVRGGEENRGFGALVELAHEGAGLPPSPIFPEGPEESREELALSLIEKLSGKRVLLAIDGWPLEAVASEPIQRFFEKLLQVAGGRPAEKTGLRIVVATSDPDRFWAHFGRQLASLREHQLRGLDRSAVRDLAADFFQTDQLSDDLVPALERITGGCPRAVWEKLCLLAENGAAVDELGFLRLEPRWRELLSMPAAKPLQSAAVEPASPEAALLRALKGLEGIALTAGELAFFLKGLDFRLEKMSEAGWRRLLEDLYWKGCLLWQPSGSEPRYRLAEGAGTDPFLDQIRQAGESSKRLQLALSLVKNYLEGEWRPEGLDADFFVSLARLAVLARTPEGALRLGRLAARRLRKQERHWEAIELLERVLSMPMEKTAPAVQALALRRARLCQAVGNPAEGLRSLESWSAPAGGRFKAAALYLQGLFLEELGRPREAIEFFQSLASEGAASRPPEPLWYQVQARLSELYLRSGDALEADRALAAGDELLEKFQAPAEFRFAGGNGSGGSQGPLPAQEGRQQISGYIEALSLYGLIHARRSEPAAAARFLRRSLQLARALGRPDLEEVPLHELATLLARSRQFDEAEEAFQACQRLAEARSDRLAKLKVLVNRATLRFRSGKFSEAEALYKEAKNLSDALGPNRCAAPILIGLEAIAGENGDWLGALRLLRKILKPGSGAQPAARANALYNLGGIYLTLGRPAKALEVRQDALAAAQGLKDRFLIGRGHFGVAMAQWCLGQLIEAEKQLKLAARQVNALEDRLLVWIGYLEGQLLIAREADRVVFRQALRSFGLSVKLSTLHGNTIYRELSLLGLVEVLLRQEKQDKAKALLALLEREKPRSGLRHPFLVEGYRWLAAVDMAEKAVLPRELAVTIQKARAAGRLWEALQLALAARRSSSQKVSGKHWVGQQLEELAGKFLRGASEEAVQAFQEVFLGHSPAKRPAPPSIKPPAKQGEVQPGEPQRSDEQGQDLLQLAWRWASLSPRSLRREGTIEEELERLRQALKLDGLWVLNDPLSNEPVAYAAKGCLERTLAVLSEDRPALEEVRLRGEARWWPQACLLPVPGASVRQKKMPRIRVLYATFKESGPPPWLESALGPVGLLLELKDLSRALAAEKVRSRNYAREVRHLHATLLREKSQLETAVISQRPDQIQWQQDLQGILQADRRPPGAPIAHSPAMKEVLNRVRQLAASDIPVLLLGEHGVGKDFIARLIHALGPRAGRPFLSEVCAVPESLLESELFGAVKGSFTGAEADRPGLLLSCHGGTLYLDRIEEMSPALQARLLRVVEEKKVRPVGGEAFQEIEVRLISSSCLSLAELRQRPGFRSDFFFRIQGAVLEIPPLRQRKEDLFPLFTALVDQHAASLGILRPEIAPGVAEGLEARDWPGNIRELENEVRRLLLERPRRLLPQHLLGPPARASACEREQREAAAELSASRPEKAEARGPLQAGENLPPSPWGELAGLAGELPDYKKARQLFERWLVIEALKRCQGNATHAARRLKISRRHLGTLLARYRIHPKDWRGRE